MRNKPSIVFVHGLWADASCFSKVIPPLQAEGYEVIASQLILLGWMLATRTSLF